jgi:tetratricopeptide (TPR) repeat protein
MPAPVEEPAFEAPPAPREIAAPEAASATLGELYLAQGHLDEAEESFQSVLRARPHDAAALAGLESVRLQRGDEAAAFADEFVPAEESNVIVGGLTARKAALLKDYLARIRRGAKRHVS